MKTLILIILGTSFFFESYAQKYEVWVQTAGSANTFRGDYDYSTDSTLRIKSKGSLFFAGKERYFQWDEVSALKVRNRTRHNTGQLIGMGVGLASGLIVSGSMIRSSDDKNWGILIAIPLVIGATTGAGTLIGNVLTSGKIVIPLNGRNSKDKNQLLKNAVIRKYPVLEQF